jgi:hypothetical protein
VRHALVHAADHDGHRRAGRNRDIGHRHDAERKGDRHADEHGRDDAEYEEDQQIVVAERHEHRARQIQGARHQDARPDHHQDDAAAHRREHEAQGGRQAEQHRADEHRGGAPGVADFHRGGADVAFVVGIFERRMDDRDQECRDDRQHDDIEHGADLRRRPADQRGQPHVLIAAHCQHRAEHAQPHEQDRGELVAPYQRAVEHVARNHVGEQQEHLDRQDARRRGRHDATEHRVGAMQKTGGVGRRCSPGCVGHRGAV